MSSQTWDSKYSTLKVFKLKDEFADIQFTESDVQVYRRLKGLQADEMFCVVNSDGSFRYMEDQ